MNRPLVVVLPVLILALGAAMTGVLFADAESFEKNLKDLGSLDPKVRAAAIEALSEGGSSTLTDLLNELDENHGVRVRGGIVAVAQEVGLSSTHGSVLKGLLDAPDVSTRLAAVQILAISPSLARPQLLATGLDDDENIRVRMAALVALGGAGADARDGLKSMALDRRASLDLRCAALRGLAACSDKGAGDVADVVADTKEDEVIRRRAMAALCESEAASVAELVSLTEADDPWVREAAVCGLGTLSATSKLSTIVACLEDKSAIVRLAALQTLIALEKDDDEREAVAELLTDDDPRVQCMACRSVAVTSKDVAEDLQDTLRGLLESGNFRVRYEAALALNEHGDTYGADTMESDKDADKGDWQTALATEALEKIDASDK